MGLKIHRTGRQDASIVHHGTFREVLRYSFNWDCDIKIPMKNDHNPQFGSQSTEYDAFLVLISQPDWVFMWDRQTDRRTVILTVSSKNQTFTILGIEENTDPLEIWALLLETTVELTRPQQGEGYTDDLVNLVIGQKRKKMSIWWQMLNK